MAHIVTCVYCKKQFNRDKEDTVQISPRRYAHKTCAETGEQNKTQEEKDLEALEAYIMKLFHEDYVNARVKKQIKDFKATYPNMTYSGMLKTLIWWYDIKGNSTEKANGGIGIIPFVYKDAYEYFYALYLADLANEDKDIKVLTSKVRTLTIHSPRVLKITPRFFDLGDDNDNEQ